MTRRAPESIEVKTSLIVQLGDEDNRCIAKYYRMLRSLNAVPTGLSNKKWTTKSERP
jgi:hypothetical protein